MSKSAPIPPPLPNQRSARDILKPPRKYSHWDTNNVSSIAVAVVMAIAWVVFMVFVYGVWLNE